VLGKSVAMAMPGDFNCLNFQMVLLHEPAAGQNRRCGSVRRRTALQLGHGVENHRRLPHFVEQELGLKLPSARFPCHIRALPLFRERSLEFRDPDADHKDLARHGGSFSWIP
jgi:hypothetical protein